MPKSTVEEWVHSHNGVAHTSELRVAGFSEYSVRRAVREGRVRYVRRSWVVTPGCDPRRVSAASVGERLTCVSAASVRGWWDVTTDAVHVALPHSASRFDTSGLRVHRARGPVPVHPRATEEPALNVLFHVARCLPPVDALTIWEAAVRREAVDIDVLARVRWRSHAADDLAACVSARSDSGPETAFVSLMRGIGVATYVRMPDSRCADTRSSDSMSNKCSTTRDTSNRPFRSPSPRDCTGAGRTADPPHSLSPTCMPGAQERHIQTAAFGPSKPGPTSQPR